ncbi:hypothetical protein CC78DRAFT_583247 [Lojkania enalia]|uniref:Uncharacterized protein n=1 Tax=Lojkania enalia TaxID=147567 RepID=A0A9P4K894_9PLEO|nr:hypothetical protein CC78DRAFT_583247 [Didymosphaeria enalia]
MRFRLQLKTPTRWWLAANSCGSERRRVRAPANALLTASSTASFGKAESALTNLPSPMQKKSLIARSLKGFSGSLGAASRRLGPSWESILPSVGADKRATTLS